MVNPRVLDGDMFKDFWKEGNQARRLRQHPLRAGSPERTGQAERPGKAPTAAAPAAASPTFSPVYRSRCSRSMMSSTAMLEPPP